jgi:FAD/FMN-containing dehydrogenase
MAFSLQANVYLATYAIWTDADEDERHRSWVHGHHARLAERVGQGVYIGDSDFSRRPDRFMSDRHFERLAQIRAGRDPHGLFVPYLGL